MNQRRMKLTQSAEMGTRFLIRPSIAIDPSLVADKDDREPRKPPIGVRATPTMQTSVQNKPRALKGPERRTEILKF